MSKRAYSHQSLDDIRTRQHLMERSFAKSDRYGFKKSRWRGLWRIQIQEYLTASIQNMMVLISNKPYKILAQRKRGKYFNFLDKKGKTKRLLKEFSSLINNFINIDRFLFSNFMIIELSLGKVET